MAPRGRRHHDSRAMVSKEKASAYQAAFDRAPVPMVVVDAGGAFLHANDAARDFGVSSESFLLAVGRDAPPQGVRLTDGRGATRSFLVDTRPLETGTLVTFRDVTELRAAEDALAQSRR